MSAHDDNCSALIQRVKDIAGEYGASFVFIANVPDKEEGGTSTPLTWAGNINTAYGLAHRARDRIADDLRDCDRPDHPPDGEDWKAEV